MEEDEFGAALLSKESNMIGGDTRLEKLLKLLSSKNPHIRKQAARALGDIQRSHPENTGCLLSNVHAYLKRSHWDARIAAADAVAHILKDVKIDEAYAASSQPDPSSLCPSLAPFDAQELLATRKPLLGSSIKTANPDKSTAPTTALDKQTQRAQVDQHLELNTRATGLSSQEFLTDDDILPSSTLSSQSSAGSSSPTSRPALGEAIDSELFLLKDINVVAVDQPFDALTSFCDVLVRDLADGSWEARHGAALGLRELWLAACSKLLPDNRRQRTERRLLQVLCLDRFNDFVGAGAIAPVRETCAQALSAVTSRRLQNSRTDNARNERNAGDNVRNAEGDSDIIDEPLLFDVAQLLGCSSVWECRQSGLLAVKYLLPVMKGATAFFLPYIVRLLEDENEEVSSAAAQSLIPICESRAGANAADLLDALAEPVWRLLIKESAADSVGSEAVLVGLLRLVHSWLSAGDSGVEKNISHQRYNALLSLVECASQDVRRYSLNCLQSAIGQSNLLTSEKNDQILITVQTLYRLVLFEPPDSTLIAAVLDCVALVAQRIGVEDLTAAVCPYLGAWLACLMTGEDTPVVDPILCQLRGSSSTDADPAHPDGCAENERRHICGPEICALPDTVRSTTIVRRKLAVARFLSVLFNCIGQCHVPAKDGQSPAQSLELLLRLHLQSTSAQQRIAVAMTLNEWGKRCDRSKCLPSSLLLDVTSALSSPPSIYDETTYRLSLLNSQCTEFISFCNKFCAAANQNAFVTSASQAEAVCRSTYESAKSVLKGFRLKELEEKWSDLSTTITTHAPDLQAMTARLSGFLAASLTAWGALPEKLTPVIKPLMECVKLEGDPFIADEFCEALAVLVTLVDSRSPCPNPKLVKNLATLLSSDSGEVPRLADFEDQKRCDEMISLAGNGTGPSPSPSAAPEARSRNAGRCLRRICELYGNDLGKKCPSLQHYFTFLADAEPTQESLNSLAVWRTVLPSGLMPGGSLPGEVNSGLGRALSSANPAARCGSCRFITAYAGYQLSGALNAFVPRVVRGLDDLADTAARLGSAELLYSLVKRLDTRLVGVAAMLAPLALGRMADPNEVIRTAAADTFSRLVTLMSLEGGAGDNSSGSATISGLSAELSELLKKNKKLLTLLTSPGQLPSVDVLKLKGLKGGVNLRHYQVEGITWMWFLNQYKLHGILSDEMGLGKTLQTLCVLASSYQASKSNYRSLIVCPRTLMAHWVAEVGKFFDKNTSFLNAMAAEKGFPMEKSASVVVTSYENLRKCSSEFSKELWHYCILDEGHVVRNPKTQLFTAVCSVTAQHRLILTGTPVQNSVLELWTLFEFLMPGYLGGQKQFNSRFGRPIAQSRDAKANSGAADAGVKALESLHKLILPFAMRRLKADVLKELPPKIVQDYYCDLTHVQTELYKSFSELVIKTASDKSANVSALKILTYLRKLVDHPCLVVPENDTSDQGKLLSSTLRHSGHKDRTSLELSGKFVALRELLRDCGIGSFGDESKDSTEVELDYNSETGQHRALIFCQWKATVELLVDYFQSGQFGQVSFLRLDGTVPVAQRQLVVDKFNADPTIDLLILTTHVGGLGLNLTGADVVVFIDHDWNPVKDVQAIDRAHRLGQKKSVNVYRLITRRTIEQKVMRLQKFKTDTADALVGSDNRSLHSMATDQLFDLLTLDEEGGGGGGDVNVDAPPSSSSSSSTRPPVKKRAKVEPAVGVGASGEVGGVQGPVYDLDQLWDGSEYDEAFDVNKFVSQLATIT